MNVKTLQHVVGVLREGPSTPHEISDCTGIKLSLVRSSLDRLKKGARTKVRMTDRKVRLRDSGRGNRFERIWEIV